LGFSLAFLLSLIFTNLLDVCIFLYDLTCIVSLEELLDVGVIIILQEITLSLGLSTFWLITLSFEIFEIKSKSCDDPFSWWDGDWIHIWFKFGTLSCTFVVDVLAANCQITLKNSLCRW